MTYQHSSVLITGASQGIGRSIAITFAAGTDRPLILLARNLEKLEETRELCIDAGAVDVLILQCDATDEQNVKNLTIPGHYPAPGILINNAGSFLLKPLWETDSDEFRHQINANLFTAVNITNRFLEDLKELDRGLIINICSVGSLKGFAESGAYTAAKHALLGYTRSLRKALIKTDVGVTAVNLGQTHSTSWSESDMSPQNLINPTDVASLLVALSNLSPRTLVEEVILEPQHGRVAPM